MILETKGMDGGWRLAGTVALSFAILLALALAGCGKSQEVGANLVTAGNPQLERSIGDGNVTYRVLGNGALATQADQHRVALAATPDAQSFLETLARVSNAPALTSPPPQSVAGTNDSLVLGFPVGLLHEQQVFGGVITAVSDRQRDDLGDLKLSDLTPVHVHAEVARTGSSGYAFALVGCDKACTEGSAEKSLLSVPIVGVDADHQYLLLDLASLGAGLNLIKILDSDGSTTHLVTQSSRTVAFDYSVSTLVFDVKVSMVPAPDSAKLAPQLKVVKTDFTARWYLRLASAFNPAFEPRPATKGVGFFMTERAKQSQVERQDLPAEDGGLKYYLKGVPEEFQASFASAFDEWNERFVALTGKKIFSYEFVTDDDPRIKSLVTGDPRFHIVEWDKNNLATYGGLGPSIANQYTGEILTSNVLIQGPTIIKLYTKWFATAQRAKALRAEGKADEADELVLQTVRAMHASEPKGAKLRLSLGEGLDFRIASQTPQLADPVAERADFDSLPPDVSYADYMNGYFHDMLTHELGHNLGLRHNFHGSLDGKNPTQEGGVSDSVMEYLGRDFRYLDHAGSYDSMALAYGYLGVAPKKTNIYCTDEDVPDAQHLDHSAECSPDDATQDPFTFFDTRLAHAVDLLVARGSSKAPEWNLDDMQNELPPVLTDLGYYAATAEKSAKSWQHFFIGGERPKAPEEVKAWVLAKLRARLCDPGFADVLKSKESDDARAKTLANIRALNARALKLLLPLKAFSASELKCDM